jgi:hypothetical protein
VNKRFLPSTAWPELLFLIRKAITTPIYIEDRLYKFFWQSQENVVSIEIFHEQLPLPVPCYDLLPVIEFTLGPHFVREQTKQVYKLFTRFAFMRKVGDFGYSQLP